MTAFMFIGCGSRGGSSSGGGKSSYKIKMITEQSSASFLLCGSGVATVDWGDGSEKVTLTLNECSSYINYLSNQGATNFRHTYPSETIRTITISGDNIMGVQCYSSITSLDVSRCTELTKLIVEDNRRLTSLDVSKNTNLTQLWCIQTQLTSLDVSKNRALTDLNCGGNPLSSSALNALFGTLHSNTGEKSISIAYTAGEIDCDKSIAAAKGWNVSGGLYIK